MNIPTLPNETIRQRNRRAFLNALEAWGDASSRDEVVDVIDTMTDYCYARLKCPLYICREMATDFVIEKIMSWKGELDAI